MLYGLYNHSLSALLSAFFAHPMRVRRRLLHAIQQQNKKQQNAGAEGAEGAEAEAEELLNEMEEDESLVDVSEIQVWRRRRAVVEYDVWYVSVCLCWVLCVFF